ncbi:unnamed protein product [Moneuplotes crassus]|uniref:PX domain-containing protein n=1 Tax=Euplotes crassus TaxID=5936 RepID=A0AAD1XA42_EUPCR|nr:unnamed protein product [Moneuplotes crassus]
MNIIVQNKRGLEFDLCDLDVRIRDYNIVDGVVWYNIEVLLSQVWRLKKRYSDFDEMHRRLRRDLDPINLPKLPEKKYFNTNPDFIESRLRALHEYLKSLILIYEALENPILQRFLEIDITYDPNFEYAPIEFSKGRELIPIKKKRRDKRVLRKESDMAQSFTNKHDRLDMKKVSSHMTSNIKNAASRKRSSKRGGRSRTRRKLDGTKKRDSFKKHERHTANREEAKRKHSAEHIVEFFPEEIKKEDEGYTGADIPKCRFFDPKLEPPIEENEPGQICLNGASDPFPLNPSQIEEKRKRDEELEDIKRKVRSMRIRNDEVLDKSYQNLDFDTNHSLKSIQDEYMTFDETNCVTENEVLLKSLIKRAAIAVENITKENSEYFELKHRAKDMKRSIDDCKRYFNNLHQKLEVVSKYFKEKADHEYEF